MARVVFVVGGPHSGTTWLCLVLGAHKNAVAVGELYRLAKQFKRLAAHKAKTAAPCAVCRGQCKFWKGVKAREHDIGAMYNYIAEKTGAEVLIDSSKKLDYIEYVQKNVPIETQIVWINRNPADAIYHYYARGLGAEEHARKWIKGVMAKQKWLAEHDHVVIDYEKAFDISTLQRVGDYIGLDVNEAMYRYWKKPMHPILGAPSAMALVNKYQGLQKRWKGNNKEFLKVMGFQPQPISFGHKLPQKILRIIKEETSGLA